jgi:hypothetical protein
MGLHQYQDSSLSLVILNGNVNKNYRLLLEMSYRGKKYKNHTFRKKPTFSNAELSPHYWMEFLFRDDCFTICLVL